MWNGRVHVRFERIFRRLQGAPEGCGLLVPEFDPYDGLRRLVAVLPGHGEPERRAVLLWKIVAVDTHRHEDELIHGLVQSQRFIVWPGIPGILPLSRALIRPVQADEADIFGFWRGLNPLDPLAELKPGPRNCHGPRLHAP